MAELNESTMIPKIRERLWSLAGAFIVVFFVSFTLLDLVGLTPNPSIAATEDPVARSGQSGAPETTVEEPLRVIAEKIGLDEKIQNPASADIRALDAALLKGVVRYPGSALAGQDANMFLFGHSSYLPFVYNKNYKVFNGIQKLAVGDDIRVQSHGAEYRYKVLSVRLTKADEALVDLSPGTRKLTLSTCNSFGAKSERFVVEAEFVASRSL